MSSTKPRGRPITKVVDRLRVAIWSTSVLRISGLPDAKAFEEHLTQRHRIQIGKGLWARYLRGDVVPHGALGDSNASLPRRLDTIYPGTANNFYDVMWTLLDWTSDIEMDVLRATYISLGDEVAVHFVSKAPVGRERVYPIGASFWHMNKTLEERRRLLRSFNPRIRLIVGLLEARMALYSQRPEAFVYSLIDACSAIVEVQEIDIAAHGASAERLYLMIEGLCLDVLRIHIIEQVTDNQKIVELKRKSLRRTDDWIHRCVSCLKTLPTKSRHDFIFSLKTEIGACVDVDFQRLIDFT